MKILVFPRDQNPYQGLLYDAVRELDPSFKISYMTVYSKVGALPFPLVALVHRLFGYRILHVHWAAFVLPKWMNRTSRKSSALFFRFCLRWARFLGFRVVWTVHNIVPHESETSDDLGGARFLAAQADSVIVHSPKTFAAMSEMGFDMSRARVIPHGNYHDHYPDLLGRATARKRLGYADDDLVFLYFGIVRSYKGVEDLVDAFRGLDRDRAHLLIVGEFHSEEALRSVANLPKSGRIRVMDSYVQDDDVAMYYRAADVVCLPFRRITTSGSAILAQSFGMPIVAAAVGDLVLLCSDVALFHQPGDPEGIRTQLRFVCDDPNWLPHAKKSAYDKVAANPWSQSAIPTLQLFRELDRYRPRRNRGIGVPRP